MLGVRIFRPSELSTDLGIDLLSAGPFSDSKSYDICYFVLTPAGDAEGQLGDGGWQMVQEEVNNARAGFRIAYCPTDHSCSMS